MRIAIVGLGGVGGYFGGKLARAYASSGEHEIIFIARGEHLKAIQQNGLKLLTREGDYTAWPNIATDQSASAGALDLILFCVKSYALEDAATRLKNNVSPQTVVIPLLNGVNSSERLKAVMSSVDIISGSVYIISHLESPGVIRQVDGACRLTFGTDDSESAQLYQHILDIFLKANINAVLSDQISFVLWTKYLLMCPLGSLTTATGKTYGEILEDITLRTMLQEMMEEVAAVAKARQIPLGDAAVEKTMALVGTFAYDAKTSMQVDSERRKPTEIDALTAYIRKAGRAAGIATPRHDEIFRLLAD